VPQVFANFGIGTTSALQRLLDVFEGLARLRVKVPGQRRAIIINHPDVAGEPDGLAPSVTTPGE
jgi:hypothetical protein